MFSRTFLRTALSAFFLVIALTGSARLAHAIPYGGNAYGSSVYNDTGSASSTPIPTATAANATSTPSASGSLPNTGTDLRPLLVAAASFLGAGILFELIYRTRHKND